METENSKLTGYLLLAVFIGPLLVAIVMYTMRDYLPIGKPVSRGELIHPAQPIKNIKLQLSQNEILGLSDLKGKWTYLLYSPGSCGLECEASLFKLRQTRTATGRESSRVQSAVLIQPERIDANIVSRYQRVFVGELINLELEDGLNQKLESGFIYLIDPNGNMMMKYDQSVTSKGMLKDIKKLLNISNIG